MSLQFECLDPDKIIGSDDFTFVERFLKDNLSAFYFDGGDNGMPWGRWDPRHRLVGLFSSSAVQQFSINSD